MKRITFITILLSILAIACCSKANAQTNVPQKMVVDKSYLTPDQLLKIESDAKIAELQKKLETYGNWVGVGGEVGTAVKEGLTAVVDVADKFGKTDVGKFTMVMVAWKIIGKDMVRIVLGILFILFASIVIFRSYRNLTVRKVLLKTNGWRFWLPKEYQLIKPDNFEGIEAVKIFHIFFMAGAFGMTYAIMFA